MEKEPEVIDMNGASPLQKGFAVFFVIMSLLYTVSPIDAIPDAVPVVGWLDDAGLLLTATMNAVQQFAKNQDSSMVKILKYAKWFLVLFTIIAVLLLGGLIAAFIALFV
ncbi:YkvA family protein [uncultured Fibrobacter sp.]|uniref:YkvA family protein n=1 Tax=uncultured Fibrobacter sp. TaxID=261512 RepID=UPI002630C049|nr:YkvA family protein [uncultured Fibrobacter sp.]